VLLVLAVELVALAAPAFGASNGSWQVLPLQPGGSQRDRVFLIYDLRPGARVRDAVTITNLTDQVLALRLYATDAVNAPGNGAWALRPSSTAPTDVGSWVRLSRTSVEVPAQGHVDVPFELAVPEDATPGDHAGGIVAASVVPDAAVTPDGGRVAVVREVGVRVYARVTGRTVKRASVSSIRVQRVEPVIPFVTGRGRTTIDFEVRNTGNARLDLTSDVEVTDVLGRTIKRFPRARMPDLLPDAVVPVHLSWNAAPPVGRVTAHVTLTAPGVHAASSTSTWAAPWAPAAVVVVGAGLTAATARTIRTRKRRGRAA
jgi:hypothetical protein